MRDQRSFLFLWSESIRRGWDWPRALHEFEYDPITDQWKRGRERIKVSREGDVSVGLLMARGIKREWIAERTKEYVESENE